MAAAHNIEVFQHQPLGSLVTDLEQKAQQAWLEKEIFTFVA